MSPKADGAAILYHFDDYALDTDRRELVKADRSIAVQPPVFDMLAFFIANRGRVVTQDELIESVWDGRSSRIDPDQPHECDANGLC